MARTIITVRLTDHIHPCEESRHYEADVFVDRKGSGIARVFSGQITGIVDDVEELKNEFFEVWGDRTEIDIIDERLCLIYELAEFVKYDGARLDDLSHEEFENVIERCDGFGQMSIDQLHILDIEWDWSHVRDSSVAALRAAVLELRSILAMKASRSA